MSVAVLGYIAQGDDIDKLYTLESAPLYEIDNITSEYKNELDLIMSEKYGRTIRETDKDHLHDITKGRVVLNYIKNNKDRVELDILYDDPLPIRTKTNSLEEEKSEVEKSRKLLLSSRDGIFLSSFMKNKNLITTTFHTIKMTYKEYKIAKNEGLNVFTKDGEYRIPISDVLKYRQNHSKLGPMRLLVEDTLEVWKNNLTNMAGEDLYFYSRELRLLLNEYDYRKIPRKIVCDLRVISSNLAFLSSSKFNLNKERFSGHIYTNGLLKRKVL